jgi:hypothetical protein
MENTENPKEHLGREKDCISYIPMGLILRLAKVHKLGAVKYGQKNWRIQPVRMSTYYNAAFRHLVEWFEHGVDKDGEFPNEHPLLHVIACCLIILDGIEHNSITDDRAFAEVLTGKLTGSQSTEPYEHPVMREPGKAPHPIEALMAAAANTLAKDTLAKVARVLDPVELAKLEAEARENAASLGRSLDLPASAVDGMTTGG